MQRSTGQKFDKEHNRTVISYTFRVCHVFSVLPSWLSAGRAGLGLGLRLLTVLGLCIGLGTVRRPC